MEWGDQRRWAVLELMGHRRLAGLVSEVEIAGQQFIRIDVLGVVGGNHNVDEPEATQYYGAAAVYCLTPCTEEAARAVASRSYDRPAVQLALPPARVVVASVPRCTTCEHEASVHIADPDGSPGPCRVMGCECLEAAVPDFNEDGEEIPF